MAYNSYTTYRSPRRRRRTVLLVFLTILVAVFALAVRSRSEQRDVLDFVAVARETLGEHREIATQAATLLLDLGDLERQVVLDRIATLHSRALAANANLAAIPVAPEVAVLAGFITVATSSWTNAVGSLDEAFLAAVDEDQDVTVGERLLASAFEELKVGDRAYGRVAELLAPISDEHSLDAFPVFSYIDPAQINLYDAVLTATRLRTFRLLQEFRDVAVSVSVDPLPVSEQNGVAVFPFADTFTASVVVSNNGNLSELNLVVTLTLAEPGGDFVFTVSDIIEELKRGESLTVVFVDLPLLAGPLYEAVVEVPTVNDSDPKSNIWRLLFRRNAGE